MRWGRHQLHPIWRRILPETLLNFSPPSETVADCFNCPKVKSEGFRPGVKCCTYHPKVPNYLLGLALNSPSKELIERLIARGFLTPEGSGHTPLQWLEVMRLDQSADYGKSEKVVCDFLDRGLCGIYNFRNSACSTYFCGYDQPWGEAFWERVHHLMARCELALVQIAMREVGFDLVSYFNNYDSLNSKTPEELCCLEDKSWKPDVMKLLWGDFYGRESDFFFACAEVVTSLRDPWQRIVSERLIRPNIMEISSMEPDALDNDQDLVPFTEVYERLLKLINRIEKRAE